MNRHLNRVQPSYGKVKRERSALPASPPDKEERPVTPGGFSTDDESSCSHHFTPPKKRQRTMSASSSSSSCSSVSFSALPEPEVEVDFPELPVDQQEIQHRAATVSPVKLIPLSQDSSEQWDPRSFFLNAPSLVTASPTANRLQQFRREARRSNPSVFAYEACPGAIIQTERAVLPSGVIYEIQSSWVPQPHVREKRSQSTQT